MVGAETSGAVLLVMGQAVGAAVRHRRAGAFSIINVSVGFVIALALSYFVVPVVYGAFGLGAAATITTMIFTASSLIRNYILAFIWME